ncbi:MAG: hypothetical protein GWO11_04675 [Desulfuromonadales bacterium]|nr:hypothetical protein [Desulfuromonadales bacterium]NIR33709.1 hypothetical protein [Desulfuromonadales bacterium]NIS44031.1 hypothetical protein [Desulfuromonadales bacterium]
MIRRMVFRNPHRRAVPCVVAVFLLAWSPCLAGDKANTSKSDVSREISQAYSAMKGYGYEKKEAFLAWAEERTRQLREQIDELDARIEKSNDEIRSELMEARRDMQQERRELGRSMKKVRKSTEAAWEDAKWGVSAAMEKLERAYERARSRFQAAEGKDD